MSTSSFKAESEDSPVHSYFDPSWIILLMYSMAPSYSHSHDVGIMHTPHKVSVKCKNRSIG